MLIRAGDEVEDVVALIRTLITAVAVVGFDENVVMVGSAGTRMYALSISTSTCTLFGLGGRDLELLKDFAALPAFTEIAVPDRQINYDLERFRDGEHDVLRFMKAWRAAVELSSCCLGTGAGGLDVKPEMQGQVAHEDDIE